MEKRHFVKHKKHLSKGANLRLEASQNVLLDSFYGGVKIVTSAHIYFILTHPLKVRRRLMQIKSTLLRALTYYYYILCISLQNRSGLKFALQLCREDRAALAL